MNRFLGTLLLATSSFTTMAQLSSVFHWSNSQTAGDRDTIDISLTNEYDDNITVNVGGNYTAFNDVVFEPLSSSISINAGATEVLRVAIYSRHNMIHNYMLPLEVLGQGTFGIQLTNEVSYTNHYSGTNNLTGESLKTALKAAASNGHNSLGYNTARNRMFMDIDNQKISQGASVNTLEGVYTGQVITNYANRSEAQNMGFNTEHTFPQGFFSSNEPMKSDIFHLFPTNGNANSQRGNLPFGVVSGNPSWSIGGSKKGGGKFEPRDEQKGQTARAMMYFVIRYQDYSNHFAGQENILRTWNEDFPVTNLEEDRNDRIDQYQGNRNPFIDYPQFVERFTSFTSNGNLSTTLSSSLSDTVLEGKQDVVYAFVFANTGTETIQINSIDLTNTTDFSMTVSGDNELLPGEGVEVELTFNTATTNTSGFVEFSTDENGGANYRVRLAGNDDNSGNPGSVTDPSILGISIYPNPVNEVLFSSESLKNVEVLDISGKQVFEFTSVASNWNVEALKSGTYILKATTLDGKNIRTQIVID